FRVKVDKKTIHNFWSAVTCHRFSRSRPVATSCHAKFPQALGRQTAQDQSGDRSPHSKKVRKGGLPPLFQVATQKQSLLQETSPTKSQPQSSLHARACS